MKTFIYYIKSNIKSLILFGIFTCIFLTLFSLKDIDLSVVGYGVILCLFVSSIFISVDFIKFYKKHSILTELEKTIRYSIENLPESDGIIESDYQSLIQNIHTDKIAMLNAADSTRTEMIDYYTIWAHQIKTPIAAMRILLQSEKNPLNFELDSELFKIEQYVEMVLSYLRLDSETSDFVIKKYNLNDIIKQAVRKYAKLFIKKKIILELSEFDSEIVTDEKWLLFVIEQVLSNSLKYTTKGKISIYMTAKDCLVIEDTGIGIAPEDLPRVFEKGFTGYNGRTDKKSTGIGLYLCKKIMKKLGHKIEVSSEENHGTKVKIIFNIINITFE